MTEQASFSLAGRNPDVLTCIANLSNDEVFTPPELANQMLDTLAASWAASNDGEDIWASSTVTFLDPFTKSGVFLREITKRLVAGLAEQIPDLEARVDHILTSQVYGIGITELTALLARRSVYCSKWAVQTKNHSHSIARSFTRDWGNIWFERTEHTWVGGHCTFCKAAEAKYGRGGDLETHAYAFIHTDDINARLADLFGADMKFDVIIGNPPYQLNDGGGTGSSALPIYQRFIEQAKRLDPKLLSMVVPARWMVGGRDLLDFRNEMLRDTRVAVLHDYPDASEVFAGVEIKGGVCYFLWDASRDDDCEIHTHHGTREVVATRPLLEEGIETFLRHSEHVELLKKIRNAVDSGDGKYFIDLLSANDTFGFDLREEGSYRRVKADYKLKPFSNAVEFYYNGWRNEGVGYVTRNQIRRGQDFIDLPKVLIPKAWGVGNPSIDRLNAFALGPGSCSTETYIVATGFKNLVEANNAVTYTQSKFFHFLVSFMKPTQNASKGVYQFVPLVDFKRAWSDEALNEHFGLSRDEAQLIEALVWPEGQTE